VETHKEGEAVPELAASVEMTEANFTQNEDNDQFAANDITVKNFQDASSTALAHYKAPARFYKGSKVVVTYKEAFVKLVFHCNTESYATALAGATLEGATFAAEGKLVTVTFATAVSTVEISMPAQVRVDSIDVYTLAGGAETPKANLSLDFEEQTVQTDFAYGDWTCQKYTTAWENVTSVQMRVREKNGSKVVNMAGGYSVPHKYTYKLANSLGLANSFSIDLGNYFSGSEYKVKVALETTTGEIIYVLGDADNWYNFAVTTALDTYTKTFEDAEIASIYIVLNSSANGSAFLYMDNVKLEYK
ncbi:MAG: hypothetical protein K6E74_02325, partial [Bacilli bacterium]|nr:hypothetical protein [Bacilli bacterium]